MHHDAQERDPVWDCTLIKLMREHGSTTVNPIYHWSDTDIWDYIAQEHIETNPLYRCGYARVGCIGCPLASYRGRVKEFSDYPKYKALYARAFDRMLKVRAERGLNNDIGWKNGEDVFSWWIEEYKHNVRGQMTIDEWIGGNK